MRFTQALAFLFILSRIVGAAPVISTEAVVVAFNGDNPSFTFFFNRTTYGPDANFYTTNTQKNIVELIPNQPDVYNPFPSTFESVVLGSFNYTNGPNTTLVHTANFATPLYDTNDAVIANLSAQFYLFENETTYNFSDPTATQYTSLPLTRSSLVLSTRVSNFKFKDPAEGLQLQASVKASSGPLSISFAKYGSPTNNLRKVVLRGGMSAVVVNLINNVTLSCSGITISNYVDISYSVVSITSPISADISFTFPSFASVFGNNTLALCGGNASESNFIEYYGYLTLDDEANPINWILVGMIAAGGILLLCCLVSLVLLVAWRYNKMIARSKEENEEREKEEQEKARKEEEAAEEKLLKQSEEGNGLVYQQGYYDYLLKKPITDITGGTRYERDD